MSVIENFSWPPFDDSLAVSSQSLVGKEAEFEVSWNLTRRLFSLSRRVSKPNDSPLTQSRPAQIEPSTIRSSRITWSAVIGPAAPRCRGPLAPPPSNEPPPAPPGSTALVSTMEPPDTRKEPDWIGRRGA